MPDTEKSYNPFNALSEEIKEYLANMEMRIVLKLQAEKPKNAISGLIDVAEVKKQLQIKDSRTIWSMVKNGALPTVRTEGNQYRFKQADIDHYKERRTEKRLNASDFVMPSLRASKSR